MTLTHASHGREPWTHERWCSCFEQPFCTNYSRWANYTANRYRCPPTVTCRKRTCQSSSSIEEVPHAADPVVVGVRDGAVGQVARHEEDVRPRARFFHREPPRYARFYAPHLFPRGRGAILAGADLTTMCIRVMCAEANLHTPFTQIKAVADTESYGLLPPVFVGAG
jgi:hypothetical protein